MAKMNLNCIFQGALNKNNTIKLIIMPEIACRVFFFFYFVIISKKDNSAEVPSLPVLWLELEYLVLNGHCCFPIENPQRAENQLLL